MKIGLQLRNLTWPTGTDDIRHALTRIARAADEAGFYSLWVMDHFFPIVGVGPPTEDMLESYSVLAYLAAETRKAKLGTLATGVIYRYPGVLVKTMTTLDVLSGGRSYFAIGAGWFEAEARGLGVPFPPLGVRFEMLEETLKIAKQMWSGNSGPYRGKHYRLDETLCRPGPLSRPHPPIMVSGGGENKTLRLVAQYADACNIHGSLDVLKRKVEVLQRHCDAVGRDYSAIEITTLQGTHLAPGHMAARDVIALCRSLAGIGVRHAIFNMPNAQEIGPLEQFGREIIPAVAEL